MYGGYYGYGYYWDPTYFLVLVGLVLCLGASALVNSTMQIQQSPEYERIDGERKRPATFSTEKAYTMYRSSA